MGGVAFKHESCELVYRLCSLALRGSQPALALVVSVGNCSISAAYQLFDFPRERRIAKIRSWWNPPVTKEESNSPHINRIQRIPLQTRLQFLARFGLQRGLDEV